MTGATDTRYAFAMHRGLDKRWLIAMPFVSSCIALWTYAVWAYAHTPHIDDLYTAIHHPIVRHQPESTALYLFGFVGMATACGLVAVVTALRQSDSFEGRSPQRFGFAVIVMLLFGIGALVRIHSVQTLYGF